jgi:hypothetical protein
LASHATHAARLLLQGGSPETEFAGKVWIRGVAVERIVVRYYERNRHEDSDVPHTREVVVLRSRRNEWRSVGVLPGQQEREC